MKRNFSLFLVIFFPLETMIRKMLKILPFEDFFKLVNFLLFISYFCSFVLDSRNSDDNKNDENEKKTFFNFYLDVIQVVSVR